MTLISVGDRIWFFLSLLCIFFFFFVCRKATLYFGLLLLFLCLKMGKLGGHMFENGLFSLIDLCNVM